jgi:hypothetical protein
MRALGGARLSEDHKMEQVNVFLAFGIGCLTALMLGFGPDVTSVLKEPGVVAASESGMLEGRLDALEERAANLEEAATGGQISGKVVAPFEVVDGKGGKIFSVSPDGNVTLFFKNKREASMRWDAEGGSLTASSPSGDHEAKLGPQSRGDTWGVSVSDNYKDRIELGKHSKAGTNHLTFFSPAGLEIAGIGEGTDTRQAVALIFDQTGNLRARMGISGDGKGLVEVLGADKIPIAQLTESESGGGRLLICAAGGAGMVVAGDAGGYGIVRVGPKAFKFIPTPGFSLPGTAITGKP